MPTYTRAVFPRALDGVFLDLDAHGASKLRAREATLASLRAAIDSDAAALGDRVRG